MIGPAPSAAAAVNNPTLHFLNPHNEYPNSRAGQMAQALAYGRVRHGSPVGQWFDGTVWRTVFAVHFNHGAVRFRVPVDMAAPFVVWQPPRSKVVLGRGGLGQEMIVWLRDIVGILGRAWNIARDQDLISKGMLVRWNEQWHSRGNTSEQPLVLDDDEDPGASDVEEAVVVKVEVKREQGKMAKKGSGNVKKGASGGYHGGNRGGFGGGSGGGTGGGSRGAGTAGQPIEI